MISNPTWYKTNRLAGLRRFAIAITILNLLGHTVLGFEQSWAQPLVALATAYSMEILLEAIDSKVNHRTPLFAGGIRNFVDFLLSAHITALAVAMLLYANERLFPIAFASAVAIGSKAIFKAPVGKATRHFLNPSNFGITVTLLLFPWIGIAPPYQFTENLSGIGDCILPGIIVISGSFLNAIFTKKLPLIAGWLGGFILQALLRSLIFGTPIVAALVPMTGVAFVLFTFYMVTDPGTTPNQPINQFIFGASVAAAYGLLMVNHIVFGFFFGLTIICILRGLILYMRSLVPSFPPAKVFVPATAMVRKV
ncbi:MAG TPA: enediyne biosynthesis protein UnbU [Cyanobacteria bacterium UBA11372]|nr:enediyne biosynthesis protein UnbU [Cyanobacteria bacterium UBA11372]